MIYGFQGNMREGKTLNMTATGVIFGVAVGSIPLYANYHIQGYPGPFTYFKKWRELEKVENSIILYDELGAAFDARNFKSKDQMIFTHLFSQMGKLGNTFMYTTQRPFQIEKRVREQTDYVIECFKNYQQDRMSAIWYNTQRGREAENAKKLNHYILEHPELIYPFYDTYELIESTNEYDPI